MLRLEQVSAGYGRRAVVHGVDFALDPGRIGCLLGPSGCGKTTLLRAIAGFEPVLAGTVHLAGEVVSDPSRSLPPERRGVGVVFQDLALFPHLTVAANIGFGLAHEPRAARDARVSSLLALAGLEALGARYPHELSGGQQQRVALARALAPRPRLLLLDEPFSSLDLALRESLAVDVRAILQREGITALLVTHDQNEAFAMADHIAVMRDGRIAQQGDAWTLYHRPATRFVADFIGQGRLLRGQLEAEGLARTRLGRVAVRAAGSPAPGATLDVLVRPDDVAIDGQGAVAGTVRSRAFRGAHVLYTLSLAGDGAELLVQGAGLKLLQPGDALRLRVVAEQLAAFPAGGD